MMEVEALKKRKGPEPSENESKALMEALKEI